MDIADLASFIEPTLRVAVNEVERDVAEDDPATVRAGEEFDHDIAVTNTTGCDVTDEITGPEGFEVTTTEPEAASVSGGTVTWEEASLEAGEIATFTVSIQVPDDAAGESFSDTATAVGNCDDQGLPPGEDTIDWPDVIADEVSDDSLVDESTDASLPDTGGSGLAILGLGAVALATRLRGRG